VKSLYLLGTTASGKHGAALIVAEKLGAEIVSVDSVKVYRKMDIGSAKPPPWALERVPHHLIDIRDPGESYSAGRFVEDAHRVEKDVAGRGLVPFFVGGTALYYKAYMYGLFQGPPADPVIRAELVALAGERGSGVLHEELSRVDPEAAARIHPNDLKRLVRALEVYRKTGKPITSFQTQFSAPHREGTVVWIDRDREDVRARLKARTRKMFEKGLVEEVSGLLRGPWGKEGRNALGYREVVDMLKGRTTRQETEVLINRHTDRFVRRQRTWFRSFPEAKPLPVSAEEGAEEVAEKILRFY
jgi:tRNA dimethylallyltransferase